MASNTREKLRLPPKSISLFCEQTALVLKSGMPLYEGVRLICQDYAETRFAAAFQALSAQLSETGSLYLGMKASDVFPEDMVNVVKISEEAGKAEEALLQFARYYEREGRIRAMLRNATVYPLALIVVMGCIIAILYAKVVPIFNEVLVGVYPAMSASSAAVMNFGLIVGRLALVFIALALVAAAIVLLLMRTGRREAMARFAVTRIPTLRRISEKLSVARFTSVMSMMLASSFPIEKAMEAAPGLVTDGAFRARIESCAKRMEEGRTFPQAVSDSGLLPRMHASSVELGFQAGQTDEALARLADLYEEEADDAIQSLISVIEPTLVATLSVVIGSILVAVMLPLVSVMTTLA